MARWYRPSYGSREKGCDSGARVSRSDRHRPDANLRCRSVAEPGYGHRSLATYKLLGVEETEDSGIALERDRVGVKHPNALPLFDRSRDLQPFRARTPALQRPVRRQQSRMGDAESELAWKDTEGAQQRAAYKLPPPTAGDRKRRVHPLVVALLWFIAAVVLFTAGMSFLQWRARATTEYIHRLEQEANRKAQLEAEQLKRDAAELEARKQALIFQKEAQRLAVIAEKQRADDAAQRAVIDEADRKAKAWSKFYRKPAVCNDASTLECANAYIRAQRTFEQKYSKGEL
jgi:hypothetical protein